MVDEPNVERELETDEESLLEEDGAEHRRFEIVRDVRKRVDRYLQDRLKGISRSKIRQLIELGGVRVNDRTPKPSTVIRAGDVIDVVLPAPAIRTIEPEPIPLDILYEDEHFIVVNKQADLIVHPARSNLSGTLINALAYHFKQQVEARGASWSDWNTRGFKPSVPKKTSGQPAGADDADGNDVPEGAVAGLSGVGAEEYRPGIVHRLDRFTTGVIVVAKSDIAHWQIARQFEQRQTTKAYLAVVHGAPDPPDAVGGVIDQPIGKHPTIREAMSVRHDSMGKPSVTLWRVRERYRGYTLVELELRTGRTHQIRVHLSHMGCPIVGDILYGGEAVGQREIDDPPFAAGCKRYMNFAREKAEGQRLEALAAGRRDILMRNPALHATLLGFTHPITHQAVRFTAPLHEPMLTLVRELRRHPAPGPVATEGTFVDLAAAVPDA